MMLRLNLNLAPPVPSQQPVDQLELPRSVNPPIGGYVHKFALNAPRQLLRTPQPFRPPLTVFSTPFSQASATVSEASQTNRADTVITNFWRRHCDEIKAKVRNLPTLDEMAQRVVEDRVKRLTPQETVNFQRMSRKFNKKAALTRLQKEVPFNKTQARVNLLKQEARRVLPKAELDIILLLIKHRVQKFENYDSYSSVPQSDLFDWAKIEHDLSIRAHLFDARGQQAPRYQPVDVDEIVEIALERERRFCAQMLGEFTQAVDEFLKTNPGEEIILQLQTRMLYDIDGTIYDETLGVRPAAVLVLRELKRLYPTLKIGLCTIRNHDNLEKQLQDPAVPGAITEIASEIDPNLIFPIYASSLAEHNNNEKNYAIFGGHNYTMANIMGWDAERTARFYSDELPQLLQFQRLKSALFKQDREEDRRDANTRKEIPRAVRLQRAWTKISALRQQIIDSPHEDEKSWFSNKRYVTDIDPNTGYDPNRILGDLGSISIITDLLNQGILDPLDSELLAFVSHYQDRRKSLEIQNQAQEAAFITYLRDTLRLISSECIYAPEAIAEILQRLAAAKHTIDKNGTATICITVDNQALAAVVNKLLKGELRIKATGEAIDGYALLGLADYRGRLRLIPVGKDAEFSAEEVYLTALAAG